jgi:hypothetical protein
MSDDDDTPEIDLNGLSRVQDRKVLEQLIEHGDDLTKRRHTILFFYRMDDDTREVEATFDPLIAAGKELGFTVSRQDDEALILEGYKLVDPENLEALSTWAESVAESAGARFDGWECAVEADKPN